MVYCLVIGFKTIYNDGEIKRYKLSDVVKTVPTMPTSKDDEAFPRYKSKIHISEPLSSPPSGYMFLAKYYNDGVNEWGYLYGDKSVSYGKTYKVNYGTGTAVSVIVGALAGILTGGGSVIVQLLASLGATIVSGTITSAISGKVYARFTHWNLEVYSQNQLGLKSEQTFVDAKVINENNGGTKWISLRTEGNQRTWPTLAKGGAYNVVIFN